MDEDARVSVMPVDHAIQRELAYREKLAKDFHGDAEFMKNLLPLQAQSSHPWHVQGSGPEVSLLCNSVTNAVYSQVPPSLPTPIPLLGPSGVKELPPSSSSLASCRVSGPRPKQPEVQIPSLNLNREVPTPAYQVPRLNPNPRPPLPWNHRMSASLGQPPRPSYSGAKRKEISGVPYSLPPRPPKPYGLPPRPPKPSLAGCITVDQFGNFFCKVCQVSCTGALCLKQHTKGHKHKAKLQLLQQVKRDGGENENPQIMCDICQIWCTDEGSFALHLKGQKHRAKLQELELGESQGKEKGVEQRQWCELCQIWCMNEDNLQQHLKGQKHEAKLHELEHGRVKPSNRRPWCELCHTWCTNEEGLELHLRGQKHVAKLRAVQEKTCSSGREAAMSRHLQQGAWNSS